MKLIKTNSLILDMDGVLWRNQQPIGDLARIFNTLVEKQVKYCFATNNSSKTIDSYKNILRSFGIPVEGDQIFTSAKATAELLAQKFPAGGNVFVVGMPGLVETLAQYGFTDAADHPLAVVAGIDYHLTYDKLKTATLLIRSGVPFFGTNPDKTFPTPAGQIPGAGSILASIEIATGQLPEVIGKPKPTMFYQALDYLGERPEDAVVVGDRLETDIAGGQAAGCKTAVTLSGVSTEKQAQGWAPKPDFIVADLAELVERLQSG
jgi:4-nitrophenyl phosphatase